MRFEAKFSKEDILQLVLARLEEQGYSPSPDADAGPEWHDCFRGADTDTVLTIPFVPAVRASNPTLAPVSLEPAQAILAEKVKGEEVKVEAKKRRGGYKLNLTPEQREARAEREQLRTARKNRKDSPAGGSAPEIPPEEPERKPEMAVERPSASLAQTEEVVAAAPLPFPANGHRLEEDANL